jgi:YYY domain-containing protein
MEALLVWLLLLELLGLLSFPLAYRVFSRLPDRGWTLSKPLGLLLLGYGVWMLGLSNTIPNSRWSVLLVLVIVAALAYLASRGHWHQMVEFVRRRPYTLLASEGLFLLLFLGWALFRAQVPDIAHTEQPMDLALLNATITSPHYPPNDPWLAGHGVSYYYLGYLMIGALTMLSGTAVSVAYNLGLVTVASLGGLAAFGIVYNLVRLSRGSERGALFAGAGAAFLLLIASNLEGALEMARAAGAGGESFWNFIGIDRLTAPASPSATWVPEDFWWWFRASRVFAITEFPMFSFVLGDMHPHVMSIPFLLLAVALAVQLFLTPRLLAFTWLREHWPLALTLPVAIGGLAAINLWDLPLGLALVGGAVVLNALRHRVERRPVRALFLAIGVAGSLLAAALVLVLANDWDSTLTLTVIGGSALLSGVVVLDASRPGVERRWVLADVLTFGGVLSLLALLLYTPFYLGFASEASGVLPEREAATRPVHLVVVWGVLGLLALWLLAAMAGHVVRIRNGWTLRLAGALSIGFAPVIIWLQPVWGVPAYVLVISGFVATRYVMERRKPSEDSWMAQLPMAALVAGGALLVALLVDGFSNASGTSPNAASVASRMLVVVPLALTASVAVYGAWAVVRRQAAPIRSGESWGGLTEGNVLVLGLVAVAAVLVMGPELFHVVDTFGRINTVFKLYYQAWVLLALVGGYALYYIGARWDRTRLSGRLGVGIWGLVLVAAFGAVAYYPAAAVFSRAQDHSPGLTLDGQAHFARGAPPEYAAVQWIKGNLPRDAVVVESAVVSCTGNPAGCSDFTEAGRIASSTGRPTILGWSGHERQWGRSRSLLDERQEDVRKIYETDDALLAGALLHKYDADYVVVGPRERRAYGESGLAKFDELGTAVFTDGTQVAPFYVYKIEVP